MHGHDDPPGVTVASELLCPPVPGSGWPRGGRGTGTAERKGRSRTAPCQPGASLPVSLGNERGDLATAARLPQRTRSLRDLQAPSPTDHLRLQLRPRPEGGRSGHRPLGSGFSSEAFGRRPGPGPAVPGLLPPRAPPRAPPRTFPGASEAWRPESCRATRRSSDARLFQDVRERKLELGHLRGMSSGTLGRKLLPATS